MQDKVFSFSVRAAIWDENNHFLLLKRSSTSSHFPDQWEWPGGKCGAGEKVQEALRREVREETGLWIEVTREIGTYSQEMDGESFPQICFYARLVGGEFCLSLEHEDSAWARLDESLAHDLTPGLREFVEGQLEAGVNPWH